MKKIALLTCVAPKKNYKCTAKELYQGELFQQLLAFAKKKNPDKTFILSGKHHLLGLDREIEPYDVNLNDVSEVALKNWAATVLKQLSDAGCDLKEDYFYIMTNETYRKYLVTEIQHFEVPFFIE